MPEIITLIARLDKHCNGSLARYTFGTTRSTISGGFYVARDRELPREINILIKVDEDIDHV